MTNDLDALEAAHRQDADVCPYCQESDIDGLKFVYVDGVELFMQRCQECGIRFATEVKTALGGGDE